MDKQYEEVFFTHEELYALAAYLPIASTSLRCLHTLGLAISAAYDEGGRKLKTVDQVYVECNHDDIIALLTVIRPGVIVGKKDVGWSIWVKLTKALLKSDQVNILYLIEGIHEARRNKHDHSASKGSTEADNQTTN
jgi:hypothetical protein